MKFIDTLKITVRSGAGGDGCVSFRREKYVPRGGPDGGNGGDGGSVIFRGDRGKQTLLDLNYKRIYEAENGSKGQGRDKTGRSGEDLIILIPFGTLIYNGESDELLADISESEPELLLAIGGRGGRGNSAFASATHRTPREAEEGTAGVELAIRMELKLIADVGIVGYPNAGKSTFISVVSAARPKVADYPFTTLTPILGVVKNQTGGSFVLADMPGLIDGAHEGVGLGHRFLRHIERTRVLLHFVDASLEESMVSRYEAIRAELSAYSELVAAKDEIVVATKVDSAIEENLADFEAYLKDKNKPFIAISSLTRGGVQELLTWTEKLLVANIKPLSDSEPA